MFIRRRLRLVLSWKFVFYNRILPVLRRLGPARATGSWAGWAGIALAILPRRRARLRASLRRAEEALDADWPMRTTWPALASNTARFLARDYPLDRQSDEAILRSVRRPGLRTPAGGDGRRPGRDPGRQPPRGPHRGGALALSAGVPLRLLVQRPRHVSRELNRRFDEGGPHPQAEFFLRRDLSPTVAVERSSAPAPPSAMAWRFT